jgi:hypothetical protein
MSKITFEMDWHLVCFRRYGLFCNSKARLLTKLVWSQHDLNTLIRKIKHFRPNRVINDFTIRQKNSRPRRVFAPSDNLIPTYLHEIGEKNLLRAIYQTGLSDHYTYCDVCTPVCWVALCFVRMPTARSRHMKNK